MKLLFFLIISSSFSIDFFEDLKNENQASIISNEDSFKKALSNESFSVGNYFLSCKDDTLKVVSDFNGVEDENSLRRSAFELINKVNIIGEDPSLKLEPKNLKLITHFFNTNAGAWFAKKII
ncbi:MAG: hypothetical protein COB02_07935 [Candidatus Cloacimonadota bacterium]|nr:MAG: hypothetical protein COB02_07935 [Candidatus Cloacimonadota bacterium]